MTFDSTVDVQMKRVYREEEKNFNQPGRTSYFTTGCWYGESQVYKDEESIFNWVLPAGMEKSLQR